MIMMLGVIMHRDVTANDVMEHDKAVFASLSERVVQSKLDGLEWDAAEYDYYYVVDVEVDI